MQGSKAERSLCGDVVRSGTASPTSSQMERFQETWELGMRNGKNGGNGAYGRKEAKGGSRGTRNFRKTKESGGIEAGDIQELWETSWA